MDDFDVLYKIILVGDAGVGKTNLLAFFTRYAEFDQPPDPEQVAPSFHSTRKPTIGVEFGTKTVVHPDGTRIRAQIWDTAGQERYYAITSSHYRRAAGAMLVYDVSNRKSFEKAKSSWLTELENARDVPNGILSCIMLVGNKIDLKTENPSDFVNDKEHESACERLKVLSKRTSAKTGMFVAEAFKELIINVHDQAKTKDDEDDYASSVVIGSETIDQPQGCVC